MRQCKIYWSLLVRHRHADSHRKPWPHKVGFHCEKGCPDQTGSLLKPKVSWTPVTRNMRLSAGTREPLLHVFLSSLHTTQQEQTPLTRKEAKKKKKKSKFPTDLWPRGDQGGRPACIQRRFKQSLWLHYLSSSSSPLHPSVDTRSHCAGADRPGITHSLAS